MMQLHPAVRTGLLWACAHQLIALCGLAGVFVASDVLFLPGLLFLLADFPAVILGDALGLLTWRPEFLIALQNLMPGASNIRGATISLFTLGALQWFLIGYAVAVRRARRESPKSAS